MILKSKWRNLKSHKFKRRNHLADSSKRDPSFFEFFIKPNVLNKLKNQTLERIQEYHKKSQSLQHNEKVFSQIVLDKWQEQALDVLMRGEHLVVDAPTTAGKTRIVEMFFYQNISNPNFRAAYTSPVKSLSNDKFKDFKNKFGAENVGLATGDVKINLDAPIVVATLECYRNSLLGVDPDLNRKLVVFDEYHYLQDYGRGSAWEEAIILTPPKCQIVLLSASVKNAADFAKWIENIKKTSCKLIRTTYRPVPLVNLININGSWILEDLIKNKLDKFKDKYKKQLFSSDIVFEGINYDSILYKLTDVIDLGLVPCVLYVGKRLSCELLVRKLCEYIPPLNQHDRQNMQDLLRQLNEEYKYLSFISSELKHMIEDYGVAYHHSGLTAPVRMCIESLLKQGALRFCAATMGLSLGVDFSVRSALIVDYRRPDERGFILYSPTEVLQMLGRAGRRGKDVVGFSLWSSVESYFMLANPYRENCNSCLRNDPTTFLGLVSRGFDMKGIENFYSKSFKKFIDFKQNFALIYETNLKNILKTNSIPCRSPVYEFNAFNEKLATSLCIKCEFKKHCHKIVKSIIKHSNLAKLHVHLHKIKALDNKDNLTEFGKIARYFPQFGGLLIAKLIHDKYFTYQNLSECVQLMAMFCIPRFKEINTDNSYEFKLDVDYIEELLEEFYPYELFPELYERSNRRRSPHLREFNPNAGFALKLWIEGINWHELENMVVSDSFSAGDLMSLLYRTAVYLNALVQAKISNLSDYAVLLRKEILREPLSSILLQ